MNSIVIPHFHVITNSDPHHLTNAIPLEKTNQEAGEDWMQYVYRKKKHCGSQKKDRSQLKLVPVPEICLHNKWTGVFFPVVTIS